jgi:hypothetical protein
VCLPCQLLDVQLVDDIVGVGHVSRVAPTSSGSTGRQASTHATQHSVCVWLPVRSAVQPSAGEHAAPEPLLVCTRRRGVLAKAQHTERLEPTTWPRRWRREGSSRVSSSVCLLQESRGGGRGGFHPPNGCRSSGRVTRHVSHAWTRAAIRVQTAPRGRDAVVGVTPHSLNPTGASLSPCAACACGQGDARPQPQRPPRRRELPPPA